MLGATTILLETQTEYSIIPRPFNTLTEIQWLNEWTDDGKQV